MAIQNINLGTSPTGVGGDTFRSTAVKINENFNNSSHAASRLIGDGTGNIPDMASGSGGVLGLGYGGVYSAQLPYKNISLSGDTLPSGFYNTTGTYESEAVGDDKVPPAGGLYNYINISRNNSSCSQIAIQANSAVIRMYVRSKQASGGAFTDWATIYTSKTKDIYDTTTAAGANVFVNSSGEMQRSTSSERYKNILSPLTLEDDKYSEAMSIEPIVYRSTAEADNPNHHFYSFSAEALGSYDKAFTLWRNTEIVTETKTDSEGNQYEATKEVDLLEPVAEGLNINALLAFNHAISIKQDKLIKSLEKRIEDLEAINKGA